MKLEIVEIEGKELIRIIAEVVKSSICSEHAVERKLKLNNILGQYGSAEKRSLEVVRGHSL